MEPFFYFTSTCSSRRNPIPMGNQPRTFLVCHLRDLPSFFFFSNTVDRIVFQILESPVSRGRKNGKIQILLFYQYIYTFVTFKLFCLERSYVYNVKKNIIYRVPRDSCATVIYFFFFWKKRALSPPGWPFRNTRNNGLAAQTSLEFFNKILFKGLAYLSYLTYFLTIKICTERCIDTKIRVAIFFWKFRISRVSVYVSFNRGENALGDKIRYLAVV